MSFVARILWFVASGIQRVARVLSTMSDGMKFVAYRFFIHQPRPEDIFIVTYPKSGTTVAQMLVYHMTTDGEDFRHLADVSPWFESAAVNDPELLNAQPSPRVIKTHLRKSLLPCNGRVIYIARNPKDVAVSHYHHQRSLYGYPGDLDQFMPFFLRGHFSTGSWFDHVESWWREREADNVLFLQYEDLRTDLEATAQRIARFLKIELSEEELRATLAKASFSSMKSQPHKFDPRLAARRRLATPATDFIRRGALGGWVDELSDDAEAMIDARLTRWVEKLGEAGSPDFVSTASTGLRDELTVPGSPNGRIEFYRSAAGTTVDGVITVLDQPPELGRILRLRIALPGPGHPVHSAVAVQWVEEPREDGPGRSVGLRFLDLEPAAGAAIEASIAAGSSALRER